VLTVSDVDVVVTLAVDDVGPQPAEESQPEVAAASATSNNEESGLGATVVQRLLNQIKNNLSVIVENLSLKLVDVSTRPMKRQS